jgi:hypothetical protein
LGHDCGSAALQGILREGVSIRPLPRQADENIPRTDLPAVDPDIADYRAFT